MAHDGSLDTVDTSLAPAAPKAFPELPQLLLLALILQLRSWGLEAGHGFLPRAAKEDAWDSIAIAAGMACLLRQFSPDVTTVQCSGSHWSYR